MFFQSIKLISIFIGCVELGTAFDNYIGIHVETIIKILIDLYL